jgi:hypothetical protein
VNNEIYLISGEVKSIRRCNVRFSKKNWKSHGIDSALVLVVLNINWYLSSGLIYQLLSLARLIGPSRIRSSGNSFIVIES